MLASLPSYAEGRLALFELVGPDLLVDGHEPEERVVFSGLSWKRYLKLDEALGDDRSGPRLYYLDGELEIMSTSKEHERIKTWLGGFMELYFDFVDLEITTRGQATMRSEFERAGAEPDESWCLHEEKEFPDLVLEVALTSGGVRKLEIYQRFGVPEVWFWRRGGLEVHALNANAAGYEQVPASRLLPGLDTTLLERCLALPSSREARRAFRASLAATK